MCTEILGYAEDGAKQRASLLAPREDMSCEDQAWVMLVFGVGAEGKQGGENGHGCSTARWGWLEATRWNELSGSWEMSNAIRTVSRGKQGFSASKEKWPTLYAFQYRRPRTVGLFRYLLS